MCHRNLFRALAICALAACSESGADEPQRATTSHLDAPAGAAQPAPGSSGLRRTLGIVLYPGFELLDVYGPAEMFGHVGILGGSSTVGHGVDIVMIAEKAGPVTSAQGPRAVADVGFADAPPIDLLMVPGGLGTIAELADSTLLDFLRARAPKAELVTSVCTGSALLAKAGLLDGYQATSNKNFFTIAEVAGPNVTWIKKARWVEDRNRVTSSGISAGTDMALGVIARLWGKDTATQIARDTEYTWNSDPTNDPFALE